MDENPLTLVFGGKKAAHSPLSNNNRLEHLKEMHTHSHHSPHQIEYGFQQIQSVAQVRTARLLPKSSLIIILVMMLVMLLILSIDGLLIIPNVIIPV